MCNAAHGCVSVVRRLKVWVAKSSHGKEATGTLLIPIGQGGGGDALAQTNLKYLLRLIQCLKGLKHFTTFPIFNVSL